MQFRECFMQHSKFQSLKIVLVTEFELRKEGLTCRPQWCVMGIDKLRIHTEERVLDDLDISCHSVGANR